MAIGRLISQLISAYSQGHVLGGVLFPFAHVSLVVLPCMSCSLGFCFLVFRVAVIFCASRVVGACDILAGVLCSFFGISHGVARLGCLVLVSEINLFRVGCACSWFVRLFVPHAIFSWRFMCRVLGFCSLPLFSFWVGGW